MNYRVLTLFLAGLFVSGCADDKPPPQAAKAPAMDKPAPAPARPAPPQDIAADDDEITYDAIDVSKLDNQWWQQYSGGGG
jgi:hypothetical protein